jgi:hypothetical protein
MKYGFFIGFVRTHPFSIMALCNIVGDLGYLGFAFAANGFVSLPKLVGALCTMVAHILLLAYGDDQARMIEAEKGLPARVFMSLRKLARIAASCLPSAIQAAIRAKPVGIPFLVLSMNGVGLMADAILHRDGIVEVSQIVLGTLIFMGTGAFAIADFVKSQRTANILTKTAPSILACASLANVGLAVTTLNGFLIMSLLAFALSNFAGFFTHINKEKGQHLHS